jgi:hypothetical protein
VSLISDAYLDIDSVAALTDDWLRIRERKTTIGMLAHATARDRAKLAGSSAVSLSPARYQDEA